MRGVLRCGLLAVATGCATPEGAIEVAPPAQAAAARADAPAPQTEEPAVYTVHERRDVAGDDAGEDAAPVPEPADADAGEDPDAEQDGSSSTGPASDARGHDSDDAA